MSEPREQINLAAPGSGAPADDLASLIEGNPVSSFTSTIEQAVRQLSLELSAIRAERDGLRLELEGLRTQYDLLRQQLADRDRFASTVRELHDVVRSLTLPPAWSTPPPPEQPAIAATSADAASAAIPAIPAAAQEPAWMTPAAPPSTAWAAPAAPDAPAEEVDWTAYLAPTPTEPEARRQQPAPDPEPAAWATYLAGGEAAPATETAGAAADEVHEPAPAASTETSWAQPTAPAEPAPDREPTVRFTLDDGARRAAGTSPFELPVVDGIWQLAGDTPRAERPGGSRLKTWAARIGSVFGAVLILAILVVAVGPKFLPYQTYFVRSGSMEPTIDVGDMIFLTRVDAADLSDGDIITFERPDRPGTMVTHRIVAVETTPEGKVFQTKGDANGSPDTWRVPARGEGWKLSVVVPKIGYVFGYLGTSQARLALLAVPAVILGILSLVDIWKPSRKRAGSRRS